MVRRELQELAWRELGIVRSGSGLIAARARMRELLRAGGAPGGAPACPEPSRRVPSRPTSGGAAKDQPEDRTIADHETANMLVAGELMAAAAAVRTESRGAHYRIDYPAPTEQWVKHLLLWRSEVPTGTIGDSLRLTYAPVE